MSYIVMNNRGNKRHFANKTDAIEHAIKQKNDWIAINMNVDIHIYDSNNRWMEIEFKEVD